MDGDWTVAARFNGNGFLYVVLLGDERQPGFPRLWVVEGRRWLVWLGVLA